MLSVVASSNDRIAYIKAVMLLHQASIMLEGLFDVVEVPDVPEVATHVKPG